jgi:hypothetical protein
MRGLSKKRKVKFIGKSIKLGFSAYEISKEIKQQKLGV